MGGGGGGGACLMAPGGGGEVEAPPGGGGVEGVTNAPALNGYTGEFPLILPSMPHAPPVVSSSALMGR